MSYMRIWKWKVRMIKMTIRMMKMMRLASISRWVLKGRSSTSRTLWMMKKEWMMKKTKWKEKAKMKMMTKKLNYKCSSTCYSSNSNKKEIAQLVLMMNWVIMATMKMLMKLITKSNN